MGFLLLFSKLLKWSVVYCNFLALLISGVVNFGLSELVVFKKSPVVDSVDEKILVRRNKSGKF
jgi:putative flippase GtrA